MPERTCDSCGENKKVQGGKTCETGHFICVTCVQETMGLFSSSRTQCSICDKPLR